MIHSWFKFLFIFHVCVCVWSTRMYCTVYVPGAHGGRRGF